MEPYEYERTRQTMHGEWLDYAEKKRAFQRQLAAIQQRNVMEQIERKQRGQTQRQTIASQGAVESTKLGVAGRKDVASMLGERGLRELIYEHGTPQEAARYRGEEQALEERGMTAAESLAGTKAAEERRLSESEEYYRGLMSKEEIPSSLSPDAPPTVEDEIIDIRKKLRKKRTSGIARQF
jgi:hypothetical protein